MHLFQRVKLDICDALKYLFPILREICLCLLLLLPVPIVNLDFEYERTSD